MKLNYVELHCGSVTYRSEVPVTKETSETTGSVTIVNSAKPGIPEHFNVRFSIASDF